MGSSKALAWILVASIVGAGIIGYVVIRIAGRMAIGDIGGLKAQLPNELEAAQREGFPMQPEQLFPHRPLDESKNAAKVVARESMAIAKSFPTSHPANASMADLINGAATPEQIGELAKVVADNKQRLDAIIAESKKVRCDFGKDYSEGFNVLFPEFASLKSASKLLCVRAQLAADSGNLREAENSLKASFQLAQYSGQEPCLIGQLVKIALCAITHRSLRQIVIEHGKDSRFLDLADRVLAQGIEPVDFRGALRSEFVVGLVTIDTIKSMKDIEVMTEGSDPGVDLGPLNQMPNYMREAWKVRHIQFWRRAFKQFPEDPHDYRAMGEVLQRETLNEEGHKSLDYVLNRILLPVFDQSALACCKERSDLAISRGVVALLRHRANTGSFPKQLDQLGGRFIDAFDGKPLRYRRTAIGFVLYSVDRDLKDDGGLKLSRNTTDSIGADFGVEFR